MRDLRNVNELQQLLLSALALVHQEDLVAIFRALREEPERNECIDLMNAELDQGHSLMEALGDNTVLYELFSDVRFEFHVWVVCDTIIEMTFGAEGTRGAIQSWGATMAGTGWVEELRITYSSCEDDDPQAGEHTISLFPIVAEYSLN